jgi:hypothetical protein
VSAQRSAAQRSAAPFLFAETENGNDDGRRMNDF